ncbi:dephospho-CoA kinase [Xylanibacillus composti]|uniref:Dephospho-CoA kinase n=1 Tax=Xylanibacillus composti TaxID=1572762 RepID=A0A8J4H2L6_9BACL|nr:dephospho-CoA kinase [Xylanibacillus composti]MDT9724820.1 dephospho-CoA kinase [Xylanibacillus composti]GIQ69827.1 dephospho-CoA kinase [Xylanibacillus composti]
MNIGLTGGIACGKSTVADMLVEKGAVLIDADRLAREVVEPGTPTLAQVADTFGQAVLLPDGSLDRKRLGQIVFADDAARKKLEALLHPPIRALMRSRMAAYEQEDPTRLVVVDVPLLYESGLVDYFSEVMVVYVPPAVQLSRLMERDGMDEAAARQRIAAQLPIEEKRKRADIVIDNSGSLAETARQVDQFWDSRVGT